MHIRRVLAAVDLTASTPKAVLAAAELAAVAKAELIVLTILRDPWDLVGPEEVEGYRRARTGSPATLAATRASERLQQVAGPAALSAPSVSYRTAFGLPGIEIPRHAEEMGADVLVLGRPSGERPQNGAPSVTAAILRRSRVPVLIAPSAHRVYRRVLAGVDDSPTAPTVLTAAITIGGCFGARIAALHVKPTSAPSVLSSDRPRWLQRLEQSERDGGVVVAACETLVRQGDPATEILAEAEHSDLLVIGYRRGTILDAPVAPGIATRVLRRATCAILAVPV
jgi:nucleotide-binding universal stress UspA family protein